MFFFDNNYKDKDWFDMTKLFAEICIFFE